RDWSSDVCSSDLVGGRGLRRRVGRHAVDRLLGPAARGEERARLASGGAEEDVAGRRRRRGDLRRRRKGGRWQVVEQIAAGQETDRRGQRWLALSGGRAAG